MELPTVVVLLVLWLVGTTLLGSVALTLYLVGAYLLRPLAGPSFLVIVGVPSILRLEEVIVGTEGSGGEELDRQRSELLEWHAETTAAYDRLSHS